MSNKLSKHDLIDRISESSGLSKKDAKAALDCTIEEITRALKEDTPVVLTGFGAFEVRARQARTGRHPQTGEPMEIPASKQAAFKAAKSLKELLN